MDVIGSIPVGPTDKPHTSLWGFLLPSPYSHARNLWKRICRRIWGRTSPLFFPLGARILGKLLISFIAPHTFIGGVHISTSRRTLLQGTAWVAPAVLATTAIPAYAASTATVNATGFGEVFEFQPANSTDPVPFSGTTNRDGQGGFDLYTTDGSTAIVSITSLTYVVLIPKNTLYRIGSLEHNYQVSAREWSPFSSYSRSTVTLADGTTLSSDNYLIFHR